MLLECSRSASLMLSRTTSLRSSPASRLPLAILDSATCRLLETQQQKRLKPKKCCTGFFSFFKVNDSSMSTRDWQFLLLHNHQRFTKVKCVSEHLAKIKLSALTDHQQKIPTAIFRREVIPDMPLKLPYLPCIAFSKLLTYFFP